MNRNLLIRNSIFLYMGEKVREKLIYCNSFARFQLPTVRLILMPPKSFETVGLYKCRMRCYTSLGDLSSCPDAYQSSEAPDAQVGG
jgi:hypothetical protein